VKKNSVLILRILIVFIGLVAFVLMIWEPQIEGRNLHASLFQIYFKDPFLAYVYVASVPFFVALFKIFKALRFIEQNKTLSYETQKATKGIRYCSYAMIAFAAVGEVFILLSESDDKAGGVFMGILVIIGSLIIGVLATVFERILRNASPTS
jgi:hypothetical protein